MAQEDKYSIRDLKKDFPNDEKCLDYLFETLHSRECSCGGRYNRLDGRKQYQCSKCRYQIAPMAGTMFEKSSTPLTLWFHALFIFSNAKSGISAKEMERQLGVTYKTAWRILKLIRESLGQGNDKLSGKVEMDEAFFGGKGNGGEYNKNYKAVMANKAKVIGAVERGGRVRAMQVPNLSAETITNFIHENIDSETSVMLTDESNRYERIQLEYVRFKVNHSKKEYARGKVHINNIEQFWGHVKRSLRGTHKSVSKKYLQSYLDAFVFLRNYGNDKMRFEVLLSQVLR